MLTNPTTKKWLDAFIARPHAALCIESQGNGQCARELVEHINAKTISKNNSPIIYVTSDKKTLGIEEIRALKKQLQLKADRTKQTALSRIVCIPDAHMLSHEAQNALLKLLEELPANTLAVLIADDRNKLLSTIRSRMYVVPILPISLEQFQEYAQAQGIDPQETQKIHAQAGGAIDTMKELIDDPHGGLSESLQQAKEFLSDISFNRLAQQKSYSEAEKLSQLVDALVHVCTVAMHSKPNTTHAQIWQPKLEAARQAQIALNNNGHTKIVYLQLATCI